MKKKFDHYIIIRKKLNNFIFHHKRSLYKLKAKEIPTII